MTLPGCREFADRNNLEVVEVNAARRTVSLSGTVEQFNGAFGVGLNQYRRVALARRHREDTGTEVYRGREGFIHVPAELVEIIVGVFGLDNRSVSHRNGTDPPNTKPGTADRDHQLYDFPANRGGRPDDRDLLRGRLPDLGHQQQLRRQPAGGHGHRGQRHQG